MATLLQGIAQAVPDEVEASTPDADEPDPITALKARTLRSLYRQVSLLGLEQSLVETIVAMVIASLKPVFEAPDTSLEDMTAACVVAERVSMATLFGLSQGVLRRSLDKAAE